MLGRTLLIVVLAGLATGCQGTGPILSRQTTMGTLKTTVSQLEFKNDQLQKQVAVLKSENRHFEDRLVQEQAENDDLATRLDNAKGLLGQRGGAGDMRTGSRSRVDDDPVDEPPPPKARSSNSRRKPPAASIPGRIEPAHDSDDVGLSDEPPPRSRLAASRRPREERWLPVARGLGTRDAERK